MVDFDKEESQYPIKRYNSHTQKMENSTASIPNKFRWFDKDKLVKTLDVKYSTSKSDKQFAAQTIERFEKRKAQVLLRKLTA